MRAIDTEVAPHDSRSSIRDFFAEQRWSITAAAGCAVIATAASLVPVVVVFAVATELFVGGTPDPRRIVGYALAGLGGVLLRAACSAAANHLGHHAAYAILRELRLALMRKLDRIPLAWVRARTQGELKKTFSDDVEKLEEGLSHGVPDILSAATVPLVTVGLLIAVDWPLGLLTLATLPVVFLILAFGIRAERSNQHAEADATLQLNSAMLSYLRGMRVVRGFVGMRAGATDVLTAIEQSRRAAELPVSRGRWPVSCAIAALSLPIVILVPASTMRYLSGDITLPVLVLFVLIGMNVNLPFYRLVGSIAALHWSVSLAQIGIREILAEPEMDIARSPLHPSSFTVEFEGVSLSYGDRVVLSGVSCTLPEGRLTAIVGPTGAGKSTMARLLARFEDPQDGAVRIGGVDVRDMEPGELMRTVVFVQQDDYIFDDSVTENIRLGRPDATDAEVRAAAERASVTEFVATLADGWSTRLGPGGALLSGGQRQRISVARAFLADAPIVVFDEATAYLDADSEAAMNAAMRELSRDRTVVIVAHRLASVAGADQILVVDAGRLGGAGTHGELLRENGLYARMWAAYGDTAGWHLEVADTARRVLPEAQPAAEPPVPDPAEATVALGETEARLPRDIAGRGFLRQWRLLLGVRGWGVLLRAGLGRMVWEGVLRAVPIWVVFITLTQAISGMLTVAWSVWAGALLLLALALRSGALAAVHRVNWSNAARSIAELQSLIVTRILRVPLGFFSKFDAGRVTTLVADDVRRLDFQNTPGMLVGVVIQPLVASTVLFALDWRLALAALAGVPLFAACMAWGDRRFRRSAAVLSEAREEAASALLEHVQGAAVLRAYPDAPQARRVTHAVESFWAASVAASVRAAPALTAGAAALELGFVVLILLGAALFAAGSVPAATLLLFLVISLVLYAPLQELGELAGYRRSQQQIVQRIAEVWTAPVLSEPRDPIAPRGAGVVFDRVEFNYEQRQTLRDVSFVAPEGEITALVGASGSGKSTITHLVARFWDAAEGSVRIGGVDVRQLGADALLRSVTAVYQDVFLFDGTVRSNVLIGAPEASEDELGTALRAAQCDFVFDLPAGLDTELRENGAILSGGQRQRISIARALLKNSPVLLLDEAVASVDAVTEARIQAALSSLARGRTVLVVTHRLSTVQGVSHIVVMDEGRVDGIGTHDELLQVSPAYRKLWRAQHRSR